MTNISFGGSRSDAAAGPAGSRAAFRPLVSGLLQELAVAAVLAAVVSLLRWVLGHLFQGLGVFSLYFPAVLLAALIGGWRAGVATMVFSGAAIWGFFLTPVATARLTDPVSPGNLLLIAIAAAPIVIAGDYVRTLLRRVQDGREALIERNLHYDALFETMLEGFALCDGIRDRDGKLIDYTIVEMNPALQRMLGVGPEAIGTKLSDGPGDWTRWLELCDRVLTTGQPAGLERHNRATDQWHEIRITRVTQSRMAQIFFDITERKKAEFHQASLFDELNHRVSNNLTLVSSILRMKARAADHDVVRDQLIRAEARVQSIAQVHKALYRGGRKDDVEFGAYLIDLCDGVKEALTHDDRIAVEVVAEPISISVDLAIPLGMVVNELVTNAVKYAFPYPDEGRISINLSKAENSLVLSIGDDGRGLGDDAESASGGLGMRLIRSLVAQVRGTLVVRRHPGATFEITAPLTATGQ